jgi:hypothetical protein
VLALCQNSRNSMRALALDRTRAWKTPSNPNGFRQSFHAWATLRTPEKPGSPSALWTSPLSLLYKKWTWENYRKLNQTFFILFAQWSRSVFIGGLSRWLGQNWGLGGPLVRLADHLTWSSGQALWQHWLSHIGYPSCRLKLTCVEDGFQKTPNLASRPRRCGWPATLWLC